MDILLPIKSKKVIVNEPQWRNDQLKCLIRERQVALTQGDLVNFRRLRNRVNRLRKSCRTKHYASKVEHLSDCDSRRWWKEVKSQHHSWNISTRDENLVSKTFLTSSIIHFEHPLIRLGPWLLLGPLMSILTTRPPLPNIVCLRNLHYSTLIKPQAQTTCPHGC